MNIIPRYRLPIEEGDAAEGTRVWSFLRKQPNGETILSQQAFPSLGEAVVACSRWVQDDQGEGLDILQLCALLGNWSPTKKPGQALLSISETECYFVYPLELEGGVMVVDVEDDLIVSPSLNQEERKSQKCECEHSDCSHGYGKMFEGREATMRTPLGTFIVCKACSASCYEEYQEICSDCGGPLDGEGYCIDEYRNAKRLEEKVGWSDED